MPSFYTRKGDEGQTGLLGKNRVYKDDVIIETLGSIDELTSVLGMARSTSQLSLVQELIIHIQRDLFHLLSEVAAAPEQLERFNYIRAEHVEWFESEITRLEEKVVIPPYFILPGDSKAGAAIDLARTVTRRAERNLVRLVHSGVLTNPNIQKYLNRLSSFLFVLELYEIDQSGLKPTPANAEKTRS
jgi:cob(I)alamin adenosyltransferase